MPRIIGKILKSKTEKSTAKAAENGKSLESGIWDAACSIRSAKDASKYKE